MELYVTLQKNTDIPKIIFQMVWFFKFCNFSPPVFIC